MAVLSRPHKEAPTPYLLPYATEKTKPTHRIRRFLGENLRIYGNSNFSLLSNDAGMPLAQKVAAYLGKQIPPNSPAFANNELRVVVPKEVEHTDVYLISSTNTHPNRSLRQHKLQADGAKGRLANREWLIDTTLTHARQDRIDQPGAPQAALGVIKELFLHSSHNPLKRRHQSHLMEQGALIVIDTHSTVPLETVQKDSRGLLRYRKYGRYQWANLESAHVLAPEVAKVIQEKQLDIVVVFPDKGARDRNGIYADIFGNGRGNAPTVKKERPVELINQSGISSEQEDLTPFVSGRDVLIPDDMIDTGGTLLQTAKLLKEQGAKSVTAVATHGIFSNDALTKMSDPALDTIIVTDTVPSTEAVLSHPKIHVVTVAPLIAEVIQRIERKQSIKDLTNGMSPGFERTYMRLSKINKYRRRTKG